MLAFENELGVQAPVGFWDPVGFTADGDVAAFKAPSICRIEAWPNLHDGDHGCFGLNCAAFLGLLF